MAPEYTAEDKFKYNTTCLFEATVKAAGNRPDMQVTDGLAGFKTGYKKAMYTPPMPRTIHIADVGIQDRHPANNIYEIFNVGDAGQDSQDTGIQVKGSGTTWPADHISQLCASPRGDRQQESCGYCWNHDIVS